MTLTQHSATIPPQATFITWGDSAAGCLKQRNHLLGTPHPIIAVLDELRIGPLADADQPQPTARLALRRKMQAVQWWYDAETYAEALDQQMLALQQRLLACLATPDPAVIWVGNTANDRLMLAMIAARAAPAKPLFIIDICQHVEAQHKAVYAVGQCKPGALLALQPQALTDQVKSALALEWASWKKNAVGWRELTTAGELLERPLAQLDSDLLTRLSHAEPRPAEAVVADLLTAAADLLPADLLYWRLDVMRLDQQLAFIPHIPTAARSFSLIRL